VTLTTAPATPAMAGVDPLRVAQLARSSDALHQAIVRAASPDFPAWRRHVQAAAGCSRPIRLAGQMLTVEAATGRLLESRDTATMPDGVIYKACGNRRAAVCPSCSKVYQRDAYQVARAGIVGGKGVPEFVAQHPAVFPTFTAPSFGPVHTRYVKRHTCDRRRDCDCRAELCHPRRDRPTCPHGRPIACFATHEPADKRVGTPLCVDCYDYPAHVVWNNQAGELWRRTGEAIRKYLRRLARARGMSAYSVRAALGKAAEMQRRGVIHFHAVLRLDGANPDDKKDKRILPLWGGFTADDLKAAVAHAARVTSFTTGPHPANPAGWRIAWGEQLLTKTITSGVGGEITDEAVAGYIAKYATKSTEATGHTSSKLNADSIDLYADPEGTHTERLIDACWTLGTPRDWRGLRRWAHMLGFGGHFFTKSRNYSVTFTILRQNRVVFRRTESAGPGREATAPDSAPTSLVVNFLQFVGAGWHTTADAMLANTSAALARDHHTTAMQQLAALAA
jgi:hypothetical protein